MNDSDFALIKKTTIDFGRMGGMAGGYGAATTFNPVLVIAGATLGGALFGAIGATIATVGVVADKISKS